MMSMTPGADRALHPATGVPSASSTEPLPGAISVVSGSLAARSRSVRGVSVGVRAGTDLYPQLSRSGDGGRRIDRTLCRVGGQVRGPGFSGLGPEDPIVDSARCDELDRDPWADLAVAAPSEGSSIGLMSLQAAL